MMTTITLFIVAIGDEPISNRLYQPIENGTMILSSSSISEENRYD